MDAGSFAPVAAVIAAAYAVLELLAEVHLTAITLHRHTCHLDDTEVVVADLSRRLRESEEEET